VPAQRQLIAPFISFFLFFLLYGMLIQGVSIGYNTGYSIFPLGGLEFDIDSRNRIKNYKFGLLVKFGTLCILMDYLGIKSKYLQDSYLVFFL